MTTITKLESFDHFMKVWPRLCVLAKNELNGYKHRGHGVNGEVHREQILGLFMQCFECGAVFLVKTNSSLVGFTCVEKRGNIAILHCVPPDNPGQKSMGKECIKAVVAWAENNDIVTVLAATSNLCGSTFRYFEKTLGFHRSSITFALPIKIKGGPNG